MNIIEHIKNKFKNIHWLNEKYTIYKWRERHISLGEENKDKTFYVIRRASCRVGLFSYVMTNLGQIEYAVKHGYVPIIDMQNNENTYLEQSLIGRVNVWEYYFQQPCGYTLNDIKHSRNIILSNGIITEKTDYPSYNMISDKEEYKRWHSISKKYLLLNNSINEEIDTVYESMFGKDDVLGVLCRGTDYIRLHPPGHPVQPTITQMIKKAKEMQLKYQCKWIYLATEDEEYYQAFYNEFGSRLKVTEAKRCHQKGIFNINDISYGRDNERFLKGKEYLINIALLAKCPYLLAGAVGGTYGALLLSDGYKEDYIFDLGLY